MTHADDGTTVRTRGGRLRALLAAGELIVAPGVFGGGTPPEVAATGIAALFELVGLREWAAVGDAWTPVQV